MAHQNRLEQLPVEIFDIILSYLTHPRSRLPGLTERQSEYDCPDSERRAAKLAYHLNHNSPPDADRFAANLFSWSAYRHPFNVLASTSRQLRALTERYCAHLVKETNRFNLPILQAERFGIQAVYPDLSGIVYRRLWLQYAPRYCVFCNTLLSNYPHAELKRIVASCGDCFYAQVYTINEVEEQFHLSRLDLWAHQVRAGQNFVLRIDVEALALRLYGSKMFHDPRGQRQLCRACLRAGTLSRIMMLRAHREAMMWVTEPGTDGWIVRRRPGATSELSESGDVWFRYLSYRKDLYFYPDDGFNAGYQLRFSAVAESSQSS